MKKTIIILSVLSTVLLGSCGDFLDIKSSDIIGGDALTADNLPALTAPLYSSVWMGFSDRFVMGIGDGYAYNADHNDDYFGDYALMQISAQNGTLGSAWGSLYNVVQQANKVIITVNAMNVDEGVKQLYIAEARFMRGVAYWYLTSLWKNVIISENPTPLVQNPLVNSNPAADVWEFLLRDMEYAAKYLPESASKPGRVTRYSAYGMLSRFYLDYSGFIAGVGAGNPNSGQRDAKYLDLAKKAAQKVIGNSAYDLMENYPDLFITANDNNRETLFAFQWVDGINGDGVQPTNTFPSYFACVAQVSGGEAWGNYVRATYDMLREYTDGGVQDLIRRKTTFMGGGDYYPEINKAEGGFRYGWDNSDETKPQYNGGAGEENRVVNVKKGITGTVADDPNVGRRNSGLNTYQLRYAEVLLNYADATLGNDASTTDATALEYFNEVRIRAGMPEKESITWENIRRERRVEFCFEGRYWYDLVARGYYRQSEVIDIVTRQERNIPNNRFIFSAVTREDGTPVSFELRDYPEWTPTTRPAGEAGPGMFQLPYPEGDLIQNPLLGDEPVPYQFSDEGRFTDELFR